MQSSTILWFIRLIKEQVPGKPIRYVVLSHFHGDHAGGLRAFIAEGATIITTSAASDIYERAVRRPHTLHPDRLRGSARRPQFEIVSGKRVISDGSRQMVVMEVTSNPHADEMLVTWLPQERLMYVADLFLPLRLESFPSRAELPMAQFFVQWLDDQGLKPQQLFSAHGSAIGRQEHLERIRQLQRQDTKAK